MKLNKGKRCSSNACEQNGQSGRMKRKFLRHALKESAIAKLYV